MWDYCIKCGGWERDPSCSARWHLSRDFMRELKKATCYPYILFSVTRVPSSGSGPPAHPQECPEVGQISTYPRSQGGTLQISPSLQAFAPPPPPPTPASLPRLHLSQPPPLSSSRSRLFSEPLNPSQASDIYSLESEYFLFLFPRASLLGEISPGFQPALPEVKCEGGRAGLCQPGTSCANQQL